jgi:SNF2 family DNA or RNA helicase
MTPCDIVASRFKLPFELYGYQKSVVNELALYPKSGHYLAVGVGKTATSTVSALFKIIMGEADRVIVTMPPILLRGWYKWLMSIPGVTATIYRGEPAQRRKLNFEAMFTLMTIEMFKRDQARILTETNPNRTVLIVDEATSIKNYASQNYKTVRDYSMDGHLMLLTGTPLAKIEDAYAYIKLIAPQIYRNFNMWRNIHITKEDFFGKPVEYANLDLLEQNLRVHSRRLLKEDVLAELPEIAYQPLFYDLADDHMALYRRLAEEQMLELEDGGKIDATQETRLWHCMQQIILNHAYFSGNPNATSAGFELVDQVLDELAGQKLIVFTNYRMTSAAMHAYLTKCGAVAVYGGISAKEQERNIVKFMEDPACQVLVAQVQSAGYGLNLQDMCADVLFMEMPLTPIQFEQAVGRVYRNGQKRKVRVRLAIASGTIQVNRQESLLRKDEQVNRVVRNYKDIRKALYGE